MSIPSFLLKKLYVKGSLKNTGNGFEFTLKNTLAPGSLIGIGSVTLDGEPIPLEAITLHPGQGEVRADEISSQNVLTFDLNIPVTVSVSGHTLSPGAHNVNVAVLTREIGRLEIDLTDEV